MVIAMQLVARARKAHQTLRRIKRNFYGAGCFHAVYASHMNPFVNLIVTLIQLYSYALFAQIILFWLIYFKIVNPYQPVVMKIYSFLNKLIEPALSRIRKLLPPVNGVDLSAIALFVGLYFVQNLLVYYLA